MRFVYTISIANMLNSNPASIVFRSLSVRHGPPFQAYGWTPAVCLLLFLGVVYAFQQEAHAQILGPNGRQAGAYSAVGPEPPVGAQWWTETSFVAIGNEGTAYIPFDEGVRALAPDGREQWTFEAGRTRAFLGTDGTVYVGSSTGRLHAFTPSGEEKWSITMPEARGLAAPPVTAPDGRIYLHLFDLVDRNRGGELHAIHPTGTKEWTVETGEVDVQGGTSLQVGNDGTVYVSGIARNASTGLLLAVRPDGETKWRFESANESLSPPAISENGTAYVIGAPELNINNSGLYAIGPNGEKKWHRKKEGERPLSTPAIGEDGTVYVSMFEPRREVSGGLYALHPDGEEKWRTEVEKIGDWSPVVGPTGTIYVSGGAVSNDRIQTYLHAISPEGEKKWRFESTAGTPLAPSIDAEGTVYLGAERGVRLSTDRDAEIFPGGLYAIDSTGEERWHFQTGGLEHSPLVANETVYALSKDDVLYAIRSSRGNTPEVHVSDEAIRIPVSKKDSLYEGNSTLKIRNEGTGHLEGQIEIKGNGNASISRGGGRYELKRGEQQVVAVEYAASEVNGEEHTLLIRHNGEARETPVEVALEVSAEDDE